MVFRPPRCSQRVLILADATRTAFVPKFGIQVWKRTCSISCFRDPPSLMVN